MVGNSSTDLAMSQLRAAPDKSNGLEFPMVPEMAANSADTTLVTRNMRARQLRSLVNFGRLYLLYGVIFLQVVIFLTEMIMNQFIHSLLLLADAYHHLFNALNCGLLVVSLKVSEIEGFRNVDLLQHAPP